MTNEELKKKIEGILQEEIEYVVVCGSSVKNVCIEHIADTLIAAWIGDVIDELVKNIMTDAEPFLSNMSRNLIRMCASKMKKELAAEMRQEVEK